MTAETVSPQAIVAAAPLAIQPLDQTGPRPHNVPGGYFLGKGPSDATGSGVHLSKKCYSVEFLNSHGELFSSVIAQHL